MIDITPFTDKLDRLGEYMNMRIDGMCNGFWINIDAIPVPNTIEQILRIYEQTGLMFLHSEDLPEPIIYPIPFEQWLETQDHQHFQKLNQTIV